MKYLAEIKLFPEEGFKGFGPLGLGEGQEGVSVFTTFISSTIGLMTVIAIIWFIFILITGAIGIMGAGGDKNALEGAKKKITSGLIGLIIVIISLFIIKLIGYLIGIPDILNLPELFRLITGEPVVNQ